MWESSKKQVNKSLISNRGNWYLLLNNKNSTELLKDQISFIEWFIYQAASHLINRKEIPWAEEKEMFLNIVLKRKLKAQNGIIWVTAQVSKPGLNT